MLKKTIKYTDIEGNQIEEEFYFNLNKAEIMEMQLEYPGGLAEHIQNIVAAKDTPAIMKVFKDLILKSFGVKSPDGKFLDKSEAISNRFSHTEAFSELFVELATNAESATAFVNGIIPNIESVKQLTK